MHASGRTPPSWRVATEDPGNEKVSRPQASGRIFRAFILIDQQQDTGNVNEKILGTSRSLINSD